LITREIYQENSCLFLGGFWISFGFINFEGSGIITAYKGDIEMFSNALGIYLLGWAICTYITMHLSFI